MQAFAGALDMHRAKKAYSSLPAALVKTHLNT
ncbi:hypothetical protein [Pseudoalteromonas sp. JB197]